MNSVSSAPGQPSQRKQSEWVYQWSTLQNKQEALFLDWIYPLTFEAMRGKTVLEAGCGGGLHTAMMARSARHVTAVDLNTVAIAREANRELPNVTFREADIASMDLGERYDIVLSVGVVHHTDDPDRTARNLARHVKPGGRLVFWVYSREGNALMEYVVEPFRRAVLSRLSRRILLALSNVITVLLYAPVYTVYRLPLKFLPYYEYFANFRRLPFSHNALNVFDKLNAPQVQFISKERVRSWVPADGFEDIHISPYCGVSWRCSATLRP
jgi:SAM-dependent methyltransferase